MNNQTELTVRGRFSPTAYRTTAKVVGVVYLLGFVVGLVGEGLIQSTMGGADRLAGVAANSTLLAIGALLWLLAVAGDAAHGILMFPILKRQHERVGFAYLGFRILDAVFIGVMVLFVLLQIPLANEYVKAGTADASALNVLSNVVLQGKLYAYEIGMIALGIAGLLLNYTLYTTRLVPRPLAIWGLVGYAIIFGGMVSEIMGSGLGLAASIPGGLWEVFIGVWLIAKGFNTSPVPAEQTTSSTPRIATAPDLVGAAR
jgi:Domain of unknown function (DUF4386)